MFYIDTAKCTGCGDCVQICPQMAIILKDNKAHIDQNLCTECGSCLEMCVVGAICEVRAPAVVRESTPVRVRPSYPLASKKQVAILAALTSLAPLAIDALSVLTKKWLLSSGERSNRSVTRLRRGTGRHQRWRGRMRSR